MHHLRRRGDHFSVGERDPNSTENSTRIVGQIKEKDISISQ